MESKTIFACEGKDDAFFLREILIENLGYAEEDISFYSIEQKKRKKQSDEIVKFMSPHLKEIKRFLVKDEGGKKGVEAFLRNNITTAFLNRRFATFPKLIAIVDSDMGINPKYGDEKYKKNAEAFISGVGETLSKPVKIRYDKTQTAMKH